MQLRLDQNSTETLIEQIHRQIRTKLLAGELDTAEALPSIRGLAQQLDVSTVTVQRAYEHLVEEGLVESRRSRGFYVAETSPGKRRGLALSMLQSRLKSAIEEALAAGVSRTNVRQTIERILRPK